MLIVKLLLVSAFLYPILKGCKQGQPLYSALEHTWFKDLFEVPTSDLDILRF